METESALKQREWRLKNREKAIANAKRAYEVRKAKDPEGHRERQRKLMAKWRANNPEKDREADRRYKEKSKHKRRETQYQKKYGITVAQFDKMFAEQGECCALCKGDAGKNGWQVDHCHTNGDVRGILCHRCNLALGLFQDDVQRLREAINYLVR